jgi:MFS family permease
MTRDLALVVVSLFAWGVGEGAFTFFQTLYMESLGATPLTIGTILSAWGLAMAIMQLPAGYLADRVGSRPLMWATWILGSLASAIMAFSQNLQGFVLGLVIYGLTSSAIAPMNAYITAARGKWTPARALSAASAGFNLGAAIGPFIGGFIAQHWGLHRIYLFAFMAFMVSTILVLGIRPISPISQPVSPSPKRWDLGKPFFRFLGISTLGMLALYLPQPLTPNYLSSKFGVTFEHIGLYGTLCSLATALFAVIFGRLNPKTGSTFGILGVISFASSIWFAQAPLGFAFGYIMLGGFRLYRAMMLAWGRNLIQEHQVGTAYGMIETANALAIVAAATLAGWLYQWQADSIYPLTIVTAVVVLGLMLLLVPDHQPHTQPTLSLEHAKD